MILRSVMRVFLALSTALIIALLAACGQKGPLYLRDNPPAGMKYPKPAAPKPVPYPAVSPAEADKRD